MAATDRIHTITDVNTKAGPKHVGLRAELVAQMQAYKQKEKSAANDDILPSGKTVERTEDGFPVGGRRNDDVYYQNFQDAEMWSKLQKRDDLSEHEKFAAGTMGLQLRRRQSDRIRDDITNSGSWDDRVNAARVTLDTWNKMAKVLDGKLNPDELKLKTKVSDELQIELWQEEWRKKRFSPNH